MIEVKDLKVGGCYGCELASPFTPRTVLLYLGKDDSLDKIHYVSFLSHFNEIEYNCNFCPIHEDFIKVNVFLGEGRINPDGLKHDKELWMDFNKGGKTYFTVNIDSIVYYFVQMCKKGGFTSSIIYPSTSECLEQLKEIKE